MKALDIGTKVSFNYAGEEKRGIIHGYRQYEDEQGQISRITYLVVELPKGKKSLKVDDTHEQIEIEQTLINPL